MVACFQPCSFGSDIYCTYNLSRGLAHLIVCIFPQQTAHILYISNNLGFLLQLRPLHSFKNRPAWNAAFGTRHWHTSSDFIAFLESWHKPPWLHSSSFACPENQDSMDDSVIYSKTVMYSALRLWLQVASKPLPSWIWENAFLGSLAWAGYPGSFLFLGSLFPNESFRDMAST